MNETYSNLQQFTIKQLSEKLNIPKPTLRFWEKELEGILVPLRTPGGQRRYTYIHMTVLEKIKELREKTGAGMVDCKKALEEAGGDIEKAEALLKKWGIEKASKKGSSVFHCFGIL